MTKKITQKPTLTIGIPAYNEAKNISNVLKDIFSQSETNFRLARVIVASDGSTDDTVAVSRSFKHPNLTVIANQNRQGISRGLNQILSKTKSDLFIILDGDIRLSDHLFCAKLLEPIISHQADLTSAVIIPSNVNSFFTRTLNISMLVKKTVFANFQNGHNIYTCYGPARAFSRRLYRQITFPKLPGNDMYSFLKCRSLGYRFIRLLDPFVYYKLPTNYSDHIKQSTRFLQAIKYHTPEFTDEFMTKELSVPFSVYLRSLPQVIRLLAQDPLAAFTYFIILLFCKTSCRFLAKVSDAWPMAESSK